MIFGLHVRSYTQPARERERARESDKKERKRKKEKRDRKKEKKKRKKNTIWDIFDFCSTVIRSWAFVLSSAFSTNHGDDGGDHVGSDGERIVRNDQQLMRGDFSSNTKHDRKTIETIIER